MEFVIDTNVLVNGFKKNIPSCAAVLYYFYGNYELKIVFDYSNEQGEMIVEKEYRNNLGNNEAFQKWIGAMFQGQQIVYKSGKLDN